MKIPGVSQLTFTFKIRLAENTPAESGKFIKYSSFKFLKTELNPIKEQLHNATN